MVLTLPMAPAIKEAVAGAQTLLIASIYTKPLVDGIDFIDKCCFIENYPGGILEIFKTEKPDVVFFPRPRQDESWPALKAGIKNRIGSAYRWYSFMYNHRVHDHRKKGIYHEAEYNTRMLEQFFGKKVETRLVAPKIAVEAKIQAKKIAMYNGLLSEESYVIFHPGSGGSARDYPVVKLALAAKIVSEESGCRIVLTGGAGENAICESFREVLPDAVNLAGKMNLYETIAFVSGAKALCANSTGILHIAASLNVPVAGLYPNTSHISARRWGPLNGNSTVLSPPKDIENPDDMSMIDSLEVAGAVLKLLKLS